jgi:hypothetical protein
MKPVEVDEPLQRQRQQIRESVQYHTKEERRKKLLEMNKTGKTCRTNIKSSVHSFNDCFKRFEEA